MGYSGALCRVGGLGFDFLNEEMRIRGDEDEDVASCGTGKNVGDEKGPKGADASCQRLVGMNKWDHYIPYTVKVY